MHTYIIAEAGVNHNGNLKTALALADAAKKAGADCTPVLYIVCAAAVYGGE